MTIVEFETLIVVAQEAPLVFLILTINNSVIKRYLRIFSTFNHVAFCTQLEGIPLRASSKVFSLNAGHIEARKPCRHRFGSIVTFLHKATFNEHIAVHPLTRDGECAISLKHRTRNRDSFPLHILLHFSFASEVHTVFQHKTIVFETIGWVHLDGEIFTIRHFQTGQFLAIEGLHRTIEVVVVHDGFTFVDVEENVYKTTTILYQTLAAHGV